MSWRNLELQIAQDFNAVGGAQHELGELTTYSDPALAAARALTAPETCKREGCELPILKAPQAGYCSVSCRELAYRPVRRAAWKPHGRARCAELLPNGSKCRRYPRKGRRACTVHGG